MPGIFAVVDHDPDDTWEQEPIDSFHLTPAFPADQAFPARRAVMPTSLPGVAPSAAHPSCGSVPCR
jgi:hypothetical protein